MSLFVNSAVRFVRDPDPLAAQPGPPAVPGLPSGCGAALSLIAKRVGRRKGADTEMCLKEDRRGDECSYPAGSERLLGTVHTKVSIASKPKLSNGGG